MSEKIIMGYWDCSECSSKKIKGTLRECPNCGKPRGEGTRFYTDDDAEVLDDEEAEKYTHGADWKCDFCGALNSATVSTCSSCGSPRESAKDDYFSMIDKEEQKIKEDAELEEDALKNEEKYSSNNKSHWGRLFSILAGCVLGVILLIAGLSHLLSPKVYDVHVDNKTWNRTISIEKMETYNESDWSLPSDARLQSTSTEFKEYKNVIDHYETKKRVVTQREQTGTKTEYHKVNNGNGTFSEVEVQVPVYSDVQHEETYQEPVYRQEPVYATKYYYEIDRWNVHRKVVTDGGDDEPYWGSMNLDSNEREGSRSESYSISVTDKSNSKKKEFDIQEEDWNWVDIDSDIKITVKFNRIVKIEK